ncbi:MAG: DNA (cytosine-5-)-methyltransferase [Muribaculaceae bacterium]
MKRKKYTFIDLFAGIGGFHQALHSVGMKCVFASEWDKNARISYEANYKDIAPNLFDNNYKYFNNDITEAVIEDIPNFDICCAGFPCQPFSIAGLRRGFDDTRGTLFFNIANIIKNKIEKGFPPKILFLENVKGLKNHEKGKTLEVILDTLTELGYNYSIEVLNAKYFGLPQNRERLFIVAWHKDITDCEKFIFPLGIDENGDTIFNKSLLSDKCIKTHVGSIFEPDETIDPKYTISDRMWEGHKKRKEKNRLAGKGFGYSLFNRESSYCSTISARYWKDGSEILIDQCEKGLNPRRLTPVEAGRLQGYNIDGQGWCNSEYSYSNQGRLPFKIVVSEKEAYKQFGNSVAIPVITRIAQEIIKQILHK